MLTHPEFFKVGVSEAGNHDFRTYGWYWGEKYMGPLKTAADDALYAKQANYTYAGNLKGKLLLIHGDMDCNNPPAQTLRLVDAFTRLGKPFDLLMVPEAGHQLPPYAMRRAWDYFVTNLANGGSPNPPPPWWGTDAARPIGRCCGSPICIGRRRTGQSTGHRWGMLGESLDLTCRSAV